MFFFFCFLLFAKQSFPQTWGHCIVVLELSAEEVIDGKEALSLRKSLSITWSQNSLWKKIRNVHRNAILKNWKVGYPRIGDKNCKVCRTVPLPNCYDTSFSKLPFWIFVREKSQQISKNCFHPDDVITTRIGGNELNVKAKFVFVKWKIVRDPIWLLSFCQ